MEFQKPAFHEPTFNPTRFKSNSSRSTTRRLQYFPAGIKVPFIEFMGDHSVQQMASHNSAVSYISQNTQLTLQPFNKNYVVQGDKVKSVYLPAEKPPNGYEIEIWNGQLSAFILVSEKFKMYNVFYLPAGGSFITILPNQLLRLRFFENSYSLLIF